MKNNDGYYLKNELKRFKHELNLELMKATKLELLESTSLYYQREHLKVNYK